MHFFACELKVGTIRIVLCMYSAGVSISRSLSQRLFVLNNDKDCSLFLPASITLHHIMMIKFVLVVLAGSASGFSYSALPAGTVNLSSSVERDVYTMADWAASYGVQ